MSSTTGSRSRTARKKRRRDAKKRELEAAAEAKVETVQANALSARADDVLFMVDTQGKKGKVKDGRSSRARASRHSRGKQASRGRRRDDSPPARRKSVVKQKAAPEAVLFDPWSGEAPEVIQRRKRRRKQLPPQAGKPKSQRATRPDKLHPSRLIAAVPVPHAGSSVNPDMEDHQDAIAEAVASELASRKEDAAALESKLANTVPLQRLAESSESEADSDDEEGEGTGTDGSVSFNRPTQDRKMTRAQRNKQARHKERLRRQRAAVQEKMLHHQAAMAPALAKQLKAKEEERAMKRQLRQVAKEERLKNPVPIIGGKRVPLRTPLAVPLSDELAQSQGKLRASKVMTAQSLVREQFTRYKQRSLFETGRQTSKRKGKTKIVGLGGL